MVAWRDWKLRWWEVDRFDKDLRGKSILAKVQRQFSGEGRVFSINGAGHPYAKGKRIYPTLTLYLSQKLTQNVSQAYTYNSKL